MQIYSSNIDGKKLEDARRLGVGVMISAGATAKLNKEWRNMSCAIDNGAFGCWTRGYPFQTDAFRRHIRECYAFGITPNMIVCPDIVARGDLSLQFSMTWATGELLGCPTLALAVQDGMTPDSVEDAGALPYFAWIFVGGTVEWKWETAARWASFAHANGKKCHIGRCGQLWMLNRAKELGADACDSASFARNNSWHIIEEHLNPHPMLPFDETALTRGERS